MTTPDLAPEESVSVFSNLSKVNTGKWAERYLLNPDDIAVSDVRWIWEEVFKEGDASTEEEAKEAARLLFEAFGGYDQKGAPITRGVFLFLKRFIPEELAEQVTKDLK